MTPAEIPANVRALEDFFLTLSEGDADRLLRLAGSWKDTPEGWGRAPDRIKSASIRRILIDLGSGSQTLLAELLFDDEPTLINVLSNFFAIRPKREVNNALGLVGSTS